MNKKSMIQIGIVMFIVIMIFIIIILKWRTGFSVMGENKDYDPLAEKISILDPLNMETVDKYEKYVEFIDKINNIILIINDQTKTKIPLLSNTQESWDKASKVIVKYSPLIDNYNILVQSAKNYSYDKNDENYMFFYSRLGIFSLEFTFISATLVHEATFVVIGGVANSLGIGSLALKCPSCASAIMSSAYWSLKTVLVEKASEGADIIFRQLNSTIIKV